MDTLPVSKSIKLNNTDYGEISAIKNYEQVPKYNILSKNNLKRNKRNSWISNVSGLLCDIGFYDRHVKRGNDFISLPKYLFTT